jgi:PAS domain S-box-containing protein
MGIFRNRVLRRGVGARTKKLKGKNLDHRHTEEALRESEKKYRDLVENMKDIFYTADEKGIVTYISPVVESISGYSSSDITGLPLIDFLHPEDIPSIAEQFQKILSGETEPNEYRLLKKSGDILWARTFTQPVFDADRIVGVQGIITDITDLKETEAELQKSEEKYRNILESIQEGYFEVDLAGKLQFFNEALCTSSGYSSDGLLGKAFHEYTTPESAKKLFDKFQEVYLTGKPSGIMEYEIITKDGHVRYAELSASLIRDAEGKPVGFRGVARDVTDEKRIEREIRERRLYLERVLGEAPDAILTMDKNYRIVDWNKGAEKLFGYSLEEMLGRDIDEMITDENTVGEATSFTKKVLSGNRLPPSEVVRYRKDGSPVNVIVAGSPIMMGGELIGAVAIYTDITERKRVEELWRRYEFIVNTSDDKMTLINRQFVIEASNDAYCHAHGLNRMEILGKSLADVWGEKTFNDIIKDKLNECFMGNTVNYQAWFEFKSLGLKYFDVTYYPYYGENGNVTHAVVVSLDITEHKKSEDALLESEERFRSIVENSHNGIFIVNEFYQLVYVNDELCLMLGYSSEDLIGRDFRHFLDEESLGLVEDRYIRRQKGETLPTRYEFNVVHKDGSKRRVEISSAVIIGLRGKTQTVAQIMDITDRKRAEEKLLESEKRYRRILENIEEGYFEVDLAGRLTFFNESMCRIAGVSRDELLGMGNLEYTSPQTAKKMYKDFNEIYRTGIPAELADYEIIQKDGSKHILEISASLIKDETGDPLGFRGVVRDVTDRKIAQQKLQKSEEKYRTILESIQEGYFEADLAGNITFFNESACRILGYSSDELQGMNNRNYTSPETAKRIYKIFSNIYQTGNPADLEDYEILRKDGSVRILEMSATLLREAEGHPIGFRGVFRDVTDRKKAEKMIRQSLREKEVMLQEIHHRVKNNMQVISSMLSLQSRHIKDKNALELFKDSQNRVRSMSLVHEKLYMSENLGRIDCHEYVRSLTNYLSQIYCIDPNIIKFRFNIDEVFFGIETATPFGLLVNELVSNALKHAFPEGKEGAITINLHKDGEGDYALVVSDDGIGIPDHIDFRNTETLGLQLVSTLADQLDAAIELHRSGGTSFEINFGELKYRQRM